MPEQYEDNCLSRFDHVAQCLATGRFKNSPAGKTHIGYDGDREWIGESLGEFTDRMIAAGKYDALVRWTAVIDNHPGLSWRRIMALDLEDELTALG